MDQDNAMAQVPLRDMRRAIAAMSMLRDSMEHMEDQEAQEISEFVERLKGYHNAAVEQYEGEQEQMIQ